MKYYIELGVRNGRAAIVLYFEEKPRDARFQIISAKRGPANWRFKFIGRKIVKYCLKHGIPMKSLAAEDNVFVKWATRYELRYCV